MIRETAIVLLTVGAGCVVPAPEVERPADAPIASAESRAELPDALRPSLAYLEREGTAWMHGENPFNTGNGCVSCHVVGFTLWSHNAAARAGLSVETAAIEQLTAEAMEFIARPGIGRPVSWSQFMLGRASDVDDQADEWTAMVDGTLAYQEPAGHWRARGQFPDQRRPVEESDAVATMWSLLALDSMGRGTADAEPGASALAWLEERSSGVSTEWLAMAVLTEHRLGDSKRADELRSELLGEQRPDGGWAWLRAEAPDGASDPSNAYSTGVALYVLRRTGLPDSHPAVRSAVEYLLATQSATGSWSVPSRLISEGPSASKDFVYEYWGTAWAVIGLAETHVAEPVMAAGGGSARESSG